MNCCLLHVPRLPSQAASNMGGWVIDCTDVTLTRNNLNIIWISLAGMSTYIICRCYSHECTQHRYKLLHHDQKKHIMCSSHGFTSFECRNPNFLRKLMYSRVPNTTVGNPYSFFDVFPSYMALFGTSCLLNFMKSSFLHFYSEFLA